MDLSLRDRFSKNTRILNVMIIQWEPICSMRRTDTYNEASSHVFAILQTHVKTAYAALSYDHIY
jgi:hypothetical protein